jgi:BMFP domain-containing protein YqiC
MIAVISFIAARKCIFYATKSCDQNGAGIGRPGASRTAMVRFFVPLASRRGISLNCRPMDARFIDDLARRLAAAVPPGLSALRRDLEDNFKAVLQSGLARLDLVSRQEFDVQAAVLRRTREKLEALEARLATLENGQKSPTAKP